MKPRERVEAVLNFTEPDRIPVIPPFQGFWALIAAGVKVPEHFAFPERGASAQLWALERAPFDALEVFWDWLTPSEVCGCKIAYPEESNPATMEPAIKTLADTSKLQMPNIKAHRRSMEDFRIASELNKKLKDERFTYITIALPFTLAGDLRGVEKMMLDILKKPEELKPLMKYSQEVLLEYLALASDVGADGVCWCDPSASAGLISPKHYRAFAMPYEKAVVDATRHLGQKALMHICGNTSDRLDAILEVSPDLMSLDYMVDLAKVERILGGHVAYMGNVDTTDIFTKKPGDITEGAKRCMGVAGKRGYALGAACDIPIGSPLENVMALANATR